MTVTNDDATRDTFTIDELGVDLNVPPGTTQRITFPADAGTYRFYCVPHAPDMAGELVVRWSAWCLDLSGGTRRSVMDHQPASRIERAAGLLLLSGGPLGGHVDRQRLR